MNIEVWSDTVCPFCYSGQAHLQKALDTFEHKDDVTVTLKSFELAPDGPDYNGDSLVDVVAKKYHITRPQAVMSQRQIAQSLDNVGLKFDWEHAKPTNTLDAQQLIHLAKDYNLDKRLKEAYLRDGDVVSDHATLQTIAEDVGLPDSERVTQVLTSNEFKGQVRADEKEAHQLGATGVPFFVFNNKDAVSGAQPAEVFTQVLNKVWDEGQKTDSKNGEPAGMCDENGCSI